MQNFNISEILGYNIEFVDNVISEMDKHVHTFKIPKRSGGHRTITAPDDILKSIQVNINNNFLRLYHPESNAHGFIKNKSIVTNARAHVGAKSIGKMDIADFFDSIGSSSLCNSICGNRNVCRLCKNYKDMEMGKCNPSIYRNKGGEYEHKCEELKALFIPDYCRDKGYDSLFTRIIALSLLNNSACQGFPTSPYWANIVLAGFDRRIGAHAVENGCTYTRYADDMTFSAKDKTSAQLREIFENKISKQLYGFGFQVKHSKTYFKDGGRFSSCGVVVNVKTNIRSDRVRNFRAAVYNATVKNADTTTPARIQELMGWGSFYYSVNPERARQYIDKLKAFVPKVEDAIV